MRTLTTNEVQAVSGGDAVNDFIKYAITDLGPAQAWPLIVFYPLVYVGVALLMLSRN